MTYNNSLSPTSYNYSTNFKPSTYLNQAPRQRKMSSFGFNSTHSEFQKNQYDNSSFLRNTMGSFKARPNRELFQSIAREPQKKPESNLRHTTGNLAELLKRVDVNRQYPNDTPVISNKYATINPAQLDFKKQKISSNVYESKPVKYDHPDTKNDATSKKSIDDLFNKIKQKNQLQNQIKRLRQQKQLKAKIVNTKSTSSLNGYIQQNYSIPSYSTSTSYNTNSTKQLHYKNPQDSINSYRKNNEYVSSQSSKLEDSRKNDYDFSKKQKDYTYTPKRESDYQKKYQNVNKRYETNVKNQYEWKKPNDNNSLSFLKQSKKNTYEATSNSSKNSTYDTYSKINSYENKQTTNGYSPVSKTKLESKEDKISKYLSSSSVSQNNQKFNNKVTIKEFKLGKSLGEGKFGNVFQAVHKPTNSLYALKKIPKAMIKSHYMIDQFILELKIQSYMNHQNLLSLHGFFHDNESIYLILDYMEEGTLYSVLKKTKKLEVNDVAKKVKQVSKGIIYMHQNGLAHRDIKPQNIVMSYGSCKLCDFGWSTMCDQRRKTYAGTFDYAAPEILEGTEYDMSVDLWCLGVLAYQLLVGKAPFYHIKKDQTKKRIINVQSEPITYPPYLSKDAIDFIGGLLKKDPQQRTKSQDLLKHPFLAKVQ